MVVVGRLWGIVCVYRHVAGLVPQRSLALSCSNEGGSLWVPGRCSAHMDPVTAVD